MARWVILLSAHQEAVSEKAIELIAVLEPASPTQLHKGPFFLPGQGPGFSI